jgi:hypothetical protein
MWRLAVLGCLQVNVANLAVIRLSPLVSCLRLAAALELQPEQR